MIRIAVDAMGGDRAPDEVVKGAVLAATADPDIQVWLVGPTDDLKRRVRATGFTGCNIDFVQATQVAGMGEHGASVVLQERKKRDLSILVATALVGEGKADAVVSAGSTGAQLAAAQVVLRRIKGISRAAIGSPFPTLKGIAILVDAGANPECDAKNLL
jgi:glycerol-3-phosphate acyltransferase PlsX